MTTPFRASRTYPLPRYAAPAERWRNEAALEHDAERFRGRFAGAGHSPLREPLNGREQVRLVCEVGQGLRRLARNANAALREREASTALAACVRTIR